MEGLLLYVPWAISFILVIWFLWLHHASERKIDIKSDAIRNESRDAHNKNRELIIGLKKLIDANHEKAKLLDSELARVKEFIEIPEPEVKSETKPEKPKPIPTPSSGTVLAKKPRKKKSGV